MRCGTRAGWEAHKAANTRCCKFCAPYDPRLPKPKKQAAALIKPGPKPRAKRAGATYTGTPAKCGTYSGYARHVSRKETPCQPCREASAAYQRARYKPSTRSLVQCGTHAGRRKHLRNKEPVCAPCQAAPRPKRKAATQ